MAIRLGILGAGARGSDAYGRWALERPGPRRHCGRGRSAAAPARAARRRRRRADRAPLPRLARPHRRRRPDRPRCPRDRAARPPPCGGRDWRPWRRACRSCSRNPPPPPPKTSKASRPPPGAQGPHLDQPRDALPVVLARHPGSRRVGRDRAARDDARRGEHRVLALRALVRARQLAQPRHLQPDGARQDLATTWTSSAGSPGSRPPRSPARARSSYFRPEHAARGRAGVLPRRLPGGGLVPVLSRRATTLRPLRVGTAGRWRCSATTRAPRAGWRRCARATTGGACSTRTTTWWTTSRRRWSFPAA